MICQMRFTASASTNCRGNWWAPSDRKKAGLYLDESRFLRFLRIALVAKPTEKFLASMTGNYMRLHLKGHELFKHERIIFKNSLMQLSKAGIEKVIPRANSSVLTHQIPMDYDWHRREYPSTCEVIHQFVLLLRINSLMQTVN